VRRKDDLLGHHRLHAIGKEDGTGVVQCGSRMDQRDLWSCDISRQALGYISAILRMKPQCDAHAAYFPEKQRQHMHQATRWCNTPMNSRSTVCTTLRLRGMVLVEIHEPPTGMHRTSFNRFVLHLSRRGIGGTPE
jgi:hypothetical protein